ncbi:HesA/MoeB/ThiF family protein, partial [Candidatus Woesearchaeota archaeon]|nr:HesA/MoeB/ThiF family protein [Candidatus Woesearchaeota archaeon]
VEESNLPRQLLYTEKDLGKSKAQAACHRLLEINPNAEIHPWAVHLNSNNLTLLKPADLILDCTDNFKTRFLINDFCKREKRAWIHASAIKTEGYVLPILPEGPCLSCFLKETSLETCEVVGVLNTITTSIAALQATLALKILMGKKVNPKLHYYNIWSPQLTEIKVNKNSSCPACNGIYLYLDQQEEMLTKFCSSGKYQILGAKKELRKLKSQWEKIDKVIDDKISLRFKDIVLFADGRALISAKSEQEARAIYSKYVGN